MVESLMKRTETLIKQIAQIAENGSAEQKEHASAFAKSWKRVRDDPLVYRSLGTLKQGIYCYLGGFPSTSWECDLFNYGRKELKGRKHWMREREPTEEEKFHRYLWLDLMRQAGWEYAYDRKFAKSKDATLAKVFQSTK